MQPDGSSGADALGFDQIFMGHWQPKKRRILQVCIIRQRETQGERNYDATTVCNK